MLYFQINLHFIFIIFVKFQPAFSESLKLKTKSTDPEDVNFQPFNEEDNDGEKLGMFYNEDESRNNDEEMKQFEEEFKSIGLADNFDLLDISKLKGKIVAISKTNHGSRYCNAIK